VRTTIDHSTSYARIHRFQSLKRSDCGRTRCACDDDNVKYPAIRTTIPEKIRKASRIKPGDKLEYAVDGDRATIRVHPGIRSFKGVLASNKGKRMSFAEIREAAAEAARVHEGTR